LSSIDPLLVRGEVPTGSQVLNGRVGGEPKRCVAEINIESEATRCPDFASAHAESDRVRVDGPDSVPMHRIKDVRGCCSHLHEIITKLRDRYGASWHQAPLGIEHCYIDRLPGIESLPVGLVLWKRSIAFPPEPARSEDVDSAGRVRLSEVYQAWIESDQNTLGDMLAGDRPAKRLRILEPAPGASIILIRIWQQRIKGWSYELIRPARSNGVRHVGLPYRRKSGHDWITRGTTRNCHSRYRYR
jgi:hypothetical protein